MRTIEPMKATLVSEPFNDPHWIFEFKWDGYRAIAEKAGDKVKLYSRNGKDFTGRFPVIVKELAKQEGDFVIDGEIIVTVNGKPSFGAIQQKENGKLGEFMVFDILSKNDQDVTGERLADRKKILDKTVKETPHIKIPDYFPERGKNFFSQVKKLGLEGVVAKDEDSVYQTGKRSKHWLKIKNINQEEVVIAGYTKSEKGEPFAALLLAQCKNHQYVYQGKVGTGFTASEAKDLRERLDTLKTNIPTVHGVPKSDLKFAVFVKPELVGEISFTEKTAEGHFRHPAFLGLREDKTPREVSEEKPISPDVKAFRKKKEEVFLNIDGNEVKIANPQKVFWPELDIKKIDLVNYYLKVADFILPFLKDRPQSMHRFPNGVGTKAFYQKNYETPVPPFVSTHKVYSDTYKSNRTYLLCQNKATLAFMINLGCIELNPWSSRVGKEHYPDWFVIDLDPEEIGFEAVIQTAQMVKAVLDDFKIIGYPKTSGATGIHIYVPTGANYTYEQVKNFAHLVAAEVNHRLPEITSVERMPAKRKGRVYVDFLQNNFGQTLASPFSVRPEKVPKISMPLEWREVKKGLTPEQFTIDTEVERLREAFEVFKLVLYQVNSIEKSLDWIEA
jgi:bifunctional non-homologous end joining protein LigD